jgi:oligoendopeptidase F
MPETSTTNTRATTSTPTSTSTSTSPSSSACLNGPAWNITCEYPGVHSNEFQHDRKSVADFTARILALTARIQPLLTRSLATGIVLKSEEHEALISQLQCLAELDEQAGILLYDLKVFVSCVRSIDGKDADAQKAESQLNDLAADLRAATQTYSLYLDRAPAAIVESYLKSENTRHQKFSLEQSRALAELSLSDSEEILLGRLRVNGPTAFSDLYDQISGAITCQIEGKEMGLAHASGLLRDSNEDVRRTAWFGIQNAWKTHEIACASVLNGLAGWRLEEAKRRSHTRKIDFLENPLHASRIRRETLFAMLDAVRSRRSISERASRAVARALGKDKLAPWDLLSSAPAKDGSGLRTFKQGMGLIRDAFSTVDQSLADFLSTMEKNRWIEGRVLSNKRHGAYCTEFRKTRTPRVYQTYLGSVSDIRTLAHELGHAYHAWVIRDLPLAKQNYPMTLAETASIFAETAFSDQLFLSGSQSEKFEISWQNAVSAIQLLANIPARFTFEKNFYERRADGFVSAAELGDLTDRAWREWYGDSLTETERQFWMTKLHFSIASVSFYNFPYTFGYLFSLSIYARRATMAPEEFLPFYVALLRDTGSMTAEALVMKHLGEDITQPAFWMKSLDIVEHQVAAFESLV